MKKNYKFKYNNNQIIDFARPKSINWDNVDWKHIILFNMNYFSLDFINKYIFYFEKNQDIISSNQNFYKLNIINDIETNLINKPKIKLKKGHTLSYILNICTKRLKQNGINLKIVNFMQDEIFHCESYKKSINILLKYCNIKFY